MDQEEWNCELWQVLQQQYHIEVPDYIKHILYKQHCDSFLVLSNLTDTSIKKFESYVQSKVYAKSIPADGRFEDYYGENTPSNCPEKFSFCEGDLIVLKYVIDCAQEYLTMQKQQKKNEKKKLLPKSGLKYITSSGNMSTLLSMLIDSANDNSKKKRGGYRYSLSMKYVSAFIYILGGQILYKTLSFNLAIPSLSTIRRFIYHNGSAREGVCRAEALKKFLDDRNLPKDIWLSEDATRLVNRVQYDPTTNQLVGFVLPIDKESMPIIDSFYVSSAEDIEKCFKNGTISSLLYVYIAQPLKKDAPYFCVLMFGTDNKFDAMNVVQRWSSIRESLENQGIRVRGFSGDGDPRILKAMRHGSQLGVPVHNDVLMNGSSLHLTEFHTIMLPEQVFIQDPVHVGTKLRNRVLSSSRILPMGAYCVSISHVKILMRKISKDKHFLTDMDVNPQDKMNFPSVVRLTNPVIGHLLQENVPDSLATQAYLRVMLYATSAFLSTTLSAVERIYCSWYAVFFFRMWRSYLTNHTVYNPNDNFITSNTYTCIELNAHGLLNIILKCLETHCFETFVPWLYGSQPCESFFRTYRSMSNVFLTVTASTLLESLHKLNRIQLLNDIISHKFESDTHRDLINFPIKKFLNASFEAQHSKIHLPSLQDIPKDSSDLNIKIIQIVLARAKHDAFALNQKLGMNVEEMAANDCTIQLLHDICVNDENDVLDVDDNVETPSLVDDRDVDDQLNGEPDDELNRLSGEEDDGDSGLMKNSENDIQLKNYTNVKKDSLKPDSPFTLIHDKEGKDVIVRKSAICWMLSKRSKLSSDRLKRVQEREITGGFGTTRVDLLIGKKDSISIGDWCLFEQENTAKYLIGNVISFAYTDEKTSGRIAYSSDYAKVEGNTKNIGVFCSWYENNGLLLNSLGKKFCHGYYPISYYRMTIPGPHYDGVQCALDLGVYDQIKSLL